MKKPWFIWLSLPGFIGLFGLLAFKQFFRLFTKNPPFDMTRWVMFCGRSVGLFALSLLPCSLMTTLARAMFTTGSAAWNAALCVIWAYVYFICVYLNWQLFRWARKERLL